MGPLLSCCRRRERQTTEHEPLLPKRHVAKPSQEQLNKFAEVMAALKAGKMPSQEQLGHVLRLVLASDFFRTQDGRDYGTLSESGKKVVQDVKETLEAMLEFSCEKNGAYFPYHVLPLFQWCNRRRYPPGHVCTVVSDVHE